MWSPGLALRSRRVFTPLPNLPLHRPHRAKSVAPGCGVDYDHNSLPRPPSLQGRHELALVLGGRGDVAVMSDDLERLWKVRPRDLHYMTVSWWRYCRVFEKLPNLTFGALSRIFPTAG